MMETNSLFFEKLVNDLLNQVRNESEKLADKIAGIITGESKRLTRSNSLSQDSNQAFSKVEIRRFSENYMITLLVSLSGTSTFSGNKGTKILSKKYARAMNTKKLIGYSLLAGKSKLAKTKDQPLTGISKAVTGYIKRKGIQGKKFIDITLKQALPKIETELQNYDFKII